MREAALKAPKCRIYAWRMTPIPKSIVPFNVNGEMTGSEAFEMRFRKL